MFRFDGSKGDDLCHPVVTVFFRDVANDFRAPALIEVDIEVGHRDTIGVEESLEDQTVNDGVQLSDFHGIGRHGSRSRTAARAHPNAIGLCPVNEVGNNEEVAGESHLGDDADFIIGPLPNILRDT